MPGEPTATNADVFAWLTQSVNTWQDVSWLELQIWMHEQGLTRAILDTAATTGSTANRTAARYLLDTITAGVPLYATDARVRTLLAASSLSAAMINALTARATIQLPRWRAEGVTDVGEMTLGKVEAVRGL